MSWKKPAHRVFVRWPMNKRKCHFPQEMGPDRLKTAQPWCLMIFWLCTAFQMYHFTSFRIPNIVVCISITCSNGYSFIEVQLQVCSLAYKRRLKAKRQDSCLSYAHQRLFQQFMSQQLSWWLPRHTQFSEALPRSLSPSDWYLWGSGKPKHLILKCYNQDGSSEHYSWALLL